MGTLRGKLFWCKIPLVFGNTTNRSIAAYEKLGDSEREEGENVGYVKDLSFDGMISSVQMFIALITLSFAHTVAIYMSVKFDGTITLLTLIGYMCIGSVLMIFFIVNRDRVLVPSSARTENDQPIRDNLTLIGITIFYFFGCMLDMFNTVASISCDSVWRMCKVRYIYVSYTVEIAFHVLRIAYLGGETLFCITFNRSTFCDKLLTRYGLMFLQAANFSLWFDALVHESAHMFSHRPRLNRFFSRCLANDTNVTMETYACVYHNSTLYGIANDYISPTFLPFTIEFTLLAGECLAHWFFHCTVAYESLPRKSDGGSAGRNNGASSDTNVPDNSVNGKEFPQEKTFPLGLPNAGIPEVGEEPEEKEEKSDFVPEDDSSALLEKNVEETTSRLFSSMVNICFILVLAFNAFLLVMAVLLKFRLLSERLFYRKVFQSSIVVFWACMVLSMAIGYHVTGSFRYKCKAHFNGLDYLLLLSSVGPLAFDVFTMIAVAGIGNRDTLPFTIPASLQIAMEVFNIFQVYFQVTFGLFAGRVVIDGADRSYRTVAFRCVIPFLAVANGALWLIGSLDAFENRQSIQEEYFGKSRWTVISNIILPLSLFFRFNSCLLFTRIYLRIRRQDTRNANSRRAELR